MDGLSCGSVHGRFQPFHNGHLDYVLQAFRQVEFLHVGLTKIFRPVETDTLSGRDAISSNPLTFYERSRLVEASLLESGIPSERFRIVPFPIEEASRLAEFIPLHVPCFTTVVSEWNNEKIERLKAQGYDVRVLETSPADNRRITSGTDVRRLIRNGDPGWTRFVPPAVADLISQEMLPQFGA